MRRVGALDGFRGLVVLWVLFNHAWFAAGLDTTGATLAGRLVADNLPVKLFVLISGFAIFHSLATRRRSYIEFLRARFSRTIPGYLIVLALCAIAMPYLADALIASPYRGIAKAHFVDNIVNAQPNLVVHMLMHIFMLHGLVPETFLPGAGSAMAPHLWMLSTFWQFYVLAPVLFALLVSRRIWLVALLGFAAVLLQSSAVVEAVGNPAFFGGFLVYFMVGAVTALLWERAERHNLRPNVPSLSLIAAVMTFLVSTDLALTIWMLVVAAAFCAEADGASTLDRALVHLLQNTQARFLGSISYELYLCHFLVLALPVAVANSWLGSGVGVIWHFGLILLMTIALSIPVAVLLRHLVNRRLTFLARGSQQSEANRARISTE